MLSNTLIKADQGATHPKRTGSTLIPRCIRSSCSISVGPVRSHDYRCNISLQVLVLPLSRTEINLLYIIGKSIPSASVKENTTWDLVRDIDTLKKHLNITRKWMVFGVSWVCRHTVKCSNWFKLLLTAVIHAGIYTCSFICPGLQ